LERPAAGGPGPGCPDGAEGEARVLPAEGVIAPRAVHARNAEAE